MSDDPLVWNASWISPAAHPSDDLGVFAFRTCVDLKEAPVSCRVRLSADQRYKLYVNGSLVTFGPQRGDERHWFYETVDLAPFLKAGTNWIGALVWNFGWMAPMAQHTVRTGFVLEGLDVAALSTPGAWKVARRTDWSFAKLERGLGDAYIDVGPGEIFTATAQEPDYSKPVRICQAEERGASGGGTPWMLVPRSIPFMKYEARESQPVTRRGSFHLRDGESVLLDYEELLCAYPRLTVTSKGKSSVTLTYCEALWEGKGKGNRNQVDGKECRGYQDRLVLDNGSATFEPLWWRTYRYLEINVVGDAVTIDKLEAIETGYPIEVESSFEADDPWVKPIWDVAVRTVERCAGETYFDCPYYEQLQYIGDSRIQALIGYYLGRDRQLQRNAVETLGWSLMENGLTQSRYPSRQAQVIPPFSLWWTIMAYDQWLYDRQIMGVKANAPTDYWHGKVLAIGRHLPEGPEFWNFADWVPDWRWGVPPGDGLSIVHELTLALAAEASSAYLRKYLPDWALKRVADDSRRRLTDLKSKNKRAQFESEHAEALLRLLQMILGIEPDRWPAKALEKANAAKCTYYFSYYKHLAMFGRPEDATYSTKRTYLDELAPWKEMIENGLTTFAENPEPTRSDCHAWSAHPILGFFQIVAGVTSIASGWEKARIQPHPGNLRRFDARIAHQKGDLRVSFEDGKLSVDSPVPFELVWRGKKAALKEGTHFF